LKLRALVLASLLVTTTSFGEGPPPLPDTWPTGVVFGSEVFWFGESPKSLERKCSRSETTKLKDGTVKILCGHPGVEIPTHFLFKKNKLFYVSHPIPATQYRRIRDAIIAILGSDGRHEDKDGHEIWSIVFVNEKGKRQGSIDIEEYGPENHWRTYWAY
jgi:hypothetical protein